MPLPLFEDQTHLRYKKSQDILKSWSKKALGIQWHITDHCNWRCTHCYHEKYHGSQPDLKQMKDIFHQIMDLGKKYNLEKDQLRIKLVGGEPLVHPNFFDLVDYLSSFSERFNLGILSNGSLFSDKNVQYLSEKKIIKLVQISIEGEEEINDSIRGKGAFNRIIKATGLLKQYNIPVHFGCTVSSQNYKNILGLLDLLLIYNIQLLLRTIVPLGQCDKDFEKIVPIKEMQKFYKEARKLNEQYSLRPGLHIKGSSSLGYPPFRFFCMSGVEALDYKGRVGFCGIRTQNILTIMPNLDVLACRLLPQVVLGNLKKNSLEEIYENVIYQDLAKLYNISYECQQCEVVDRCFGGAMCISKAVTGNEFSKDPQCWK